MLCYAMLCYVILCYALCVPVPTVLTGGAAHGGGRGEDLAGAPQGQHKGIPPAPPPHTRGLPVHRPAGAHRRDHGHLLLRPHRHAAGYVVHSLPT